VQYRTGIYYDESAAEELLPAIREVVAAKEEELHQQLATEVAPLHNYYPAEEYHQKYLEKRPFGYCHIPKKYFFRQYAMDKAAEETGD
jgi:peptide methionine sulfoxide reductase MsrA